MKEINVFNEFNEFNEFIDYVIVFYGQNGIYDMGVTRDDALLATGIRLESRKDIEFECDSVDREFVRDILIERLGYKWPQVTE